LPAVRESDFAGALHSLSIPLGEVGRQDEGLAAIEEAVAIRRRLVQAEPAVHEPGLANSLHCLSIDYGVVGRRDEGLAAIEEAVSAYL